MARQTQVLGLDIGRHAVKAVRVETRNGRPVIAAADTLRIPPGMADARAMILPWLAKTGADRAPCAIGLPGAQVMFQPFALPPGDPRSFAQAASMEVVRFNELASEPMQFSFVPVTFRPGEKRLLLAMTRRTVMDTVLSSARELDIDIVDLVPTPVALFNIHETTCTPHREPVLYADIGQSATLLAGGSTEAGLMFARSFSSGGQMFTDAIARARGCSASQAETVKLAEAGLEAADADLAAAVRGVADLWITELQACLSVYRNLYTDHGARFARMVLTGGAAALPGLADYIGTRLKMQVELAAGWPARGTVETPWSYAVAAGLAVTATGPAPAPLSLLPETLRDELTFRRQKPFWIGAAIAASLILGVSLAGGYRDFRRKERELNEQRASLRRRQAAAGDIETIKASSDTIRRMTVPIQDLLATAPTMREIISLLATCKTTNDAITLVADAESYFKKDPLAVPVAGTGGGASPRTPRGEPPAAPEPRVRAVVVEGYTHRRDFSTVKALIDRLNAADMVASADLLSDDKLMDDTLPPEPGAYADAQRFVIDIRLKTP